MKTTILFDLDGTLLPMDQEFFMKAYFDALGKKCVSLSLDAQAMTGAIWAATKAMMKNDGSMTNEARCWNVLNETMGDAIAGKKELLTSFYEHEFCKIGDFVTPDPRAKQCVTRLKEKGYTLVLATTPLFPRVATLERIRWAGLSPDDFSLISTYEDFSFTKPNPEYYREVLKKCDKQPDECLLVGNDTVEDMAAAKAGISLFFLTEHLINQNNTDLSAFDHGDFDALCAFVESLPDVN